MNGCKFGSRIQSWISTVPRLPSEQLRFGIEPLGINYGRELDLAYARREAAGKRAREPAQGIALALGGGRSF
jgi:hypothetical protein